MQAILDFFTGIWNVITSLIDFVVGIVEDLVYVVKLTGTFLVQIPNYFGWLPTAYVTLIVTIFGIVVIYKILGREG